MKYFITQDLNSDDGMTLFAWECDDVPAFVDSIVARALEVASRHDEWTRQRKEAENLLETQKDALNKESNNGYFKAMRELARTQHINRPSFWMEVQGMIVTYDYVLRLTPEHFFTQDAFWNIHRKPL